MTVKTHGHKQAVKGFKRAHRLLGKPAAYIVPPIADWTLPAGATFDPHRDQFMDASHRVIELDWEDQTLTPINYLPNNSTYRFSLNVGGVGVDESTRITVLWVDGVMDTIQSAWGIKLGDTLFRVKSATPAPLGVPEPSSIDISLQED